MIRKVWCSSQQIFSSVSAGLVRAPDRWHRAERKSTVGKASKVVSCLDVELEGEDMDKIIAMMDKRRRCGHVDKTVINDG